MGSTKPIKKHLVGQCVVVTGGATGIGRALVRRFLDAGADVLAFDRDGGQLERLVEECSRYDLPLQTFKGDVTVADDLDAAIAATKKIGRRIDLWINNAGISIVGAFRETKETDFDRVMDVNLTAVIQATRKVLHVMEEAGHGTIVNMASVAGHLAPPLMTAYSAAKHGVVGFTRSLSAELELRDSPVRVVLVSPGFVDTGIIMKGSKGGFPEWLSWMLSKPEQVADEIFAGIKSGSREIFPTWNGRMMLGMSKALPRLSVRGSRLLLARNWKDFFLNRLE